MIELKSSRNLCLEIRKVFSGEVVCSDIQSYQPTQRFDGISTSKSADGRYFLEFTEQLVEKILAANAKLKMEELWYTEDKSGRKGSGG